MRETKKDFADARKALQDKGIPAEKLAEFEALEKGDKFTKAEIARMKKALEDEEDREYCSCTKKEGAFTKDDCAKDGDADRLDADGEVCAWGARKAMVKREGDIKVKKEKAAADKAKKDKEDKDDLVCSAAIAKAMLTLKDGECKGIDTQMTCAQGVFDKSGIKMSDVIRDMEMGQKELKTKKEGLKKTIEDAKKAKIAGGEAAKPIAGGEAAKASGAPASGAKEEVKEEVTEVVDEKKDAAAGSGADAKTTADAGAKAGADAGVKADVEVKADTKAGAGAVGAPLRRRLASLRRILEAAGKVTTSAKIGAGAAAEGDVKTAAKASAAMLAAGGELRTALKTAGAGAGMADMAAK